MSQAADALVKMGTIGVPYRALWGKIPGVEKSDVDEWAEMAAEGDPIRRMQLEMERQYGGKADVAASAPDAVAPIEPSSSQ